jgi:geranylgeranyl pyrophosphate synthase
MDSHPNDSAVIELINHKCVTDENEIKRVILEIKNSDAIEKSFAEAKKFVLEAQKSLDLFAECSAKTALFDLASYTIDRSI